MSWAAGQIRQSISQRHSFFGAVENQIASSHKALLAMKINIDEKLDPPENVVPEPVFKHASPRPGGLGPSKKDGHPGNATCRAGATRRATTIRHFSFHRSFSNTRLRTQRLRIIENDVGNIIAIIRQNVFLVAAFVSMPHFSDLRALRFAPPLGQRIAHPTWLRRLIFRSVIKTQNLNSVIPAKAGIHLAMTKSTCIPAFAGMTRQGIAFVEAYS